MVCDSDNIVQQGKFGIFHGKVEVYYIDFAAERLELLLRFAKGTIIGILDEKGSPCEILFILHVSLISHDTCW